MLIVEIILAIVILSFAGRGWKAGLIESLGELVGSVIAFLAARWLSSYMAIPFSAIFPGREGLARFVAFVIIFTLVLKLIGWLFMLAAKLLKIVTALPIVSLVDSALGAVCGFLSGIVLVGSTVYLVMTYRLDPHLMVWLGGSTVAQWSQAAFENVLRFLL